MLDNLLNQNIYVKSYANIDVLQIFSTYQQ